MPGEARKIPFTAAQRATIRATALLMLAVGAIMLFTSVVKIIALLPMIELLGLMPLIFGVQWLDALIELAFAVCLFVAALALLSVARAGTVDALLRGLRRCAWST
jgi:ABC-type protease/lipase transport system fused ATPase/permease subunit